MTNNDILAEYVRKNYPHIEKTIEFVCFKSIKKFANIWEALKKIGGNYEETNFNNIDIDTDDHDAADVGTGEDADTIHHEDCGTERESDQDSQDHLQVKAEQEADGHEPGEDLGDSDIQG